MTSPRQGGLALIVLALTSGVAAQEPRFADLLFAPNASGVRARGCCVIARDEIRGEGVTVRQIMEAAYRRHAFDRREVIGGPSWIDEDRFDFTARVAGGHNYDRTGFAAATVATLRAHANHHAVIRLESQERPVYALTWVRDVGPGLRRSTIDCGAQIRAMERGETIQGRPCGASPYPGRLMAGGITIADLASLIARWVDRPVIDRTGLQGQFDVDLEGVEVKPAGPFGPSYRPSSTTQSIFASIQSQLGMRLQPVNAPVEVVIVQAAERPSRR
jgi:uncharacterized protein (TIGR03435 family)